MKKVFFARKFSQFSCYELMNLKRAKEILGEDARLYSDKEILSILNLLNEIEHVIYLEYRKENGWQVDENEYNSFKDFFVNNTSIITSDE